MPTHVPKPCAQTKSTYDFCRKCLILWSGKRDLNPQPSAWEGDYSFYIILFLLVFFSLGTFKKPCYVPMSHVPMCPGHMATSCRIGGEGEGRHSPALLRGGDILIMPGHNLHAVTHEVGNGAVVPSGGYEISGKCVA